MKSWSEQMVAERAIESEREREKYRDKYSDKDWNTERDIKKRKRER